MHATNVLHIKGIWHTIAFHEQCVTHCSSLRRRAFINHREVPGRRRPTVDNTARSWGKCSLKIACNCRTIARNCHYREFEKCKRRKIILCTRLPADPSILQDSFSPLSPSNGRIGCILHPGHLTSPLFPTLHINSFWKNRSSSKRP